MRNGSVITPARHSAPYWRNCKALSGCGFALLFLLSWHRKARGSAHLRLWLRCACPSGKLHSASAPLRTPCLLCRRNSSFPAVQWMQWGAGAPEIRKCGLSCTPYRLYAEQQGAARSGKPIIPVIPCAAGAGRRSHLAAARRRKPEKAKSHISPLFWPFRWEKR